MPQPTEQHQIAREVEGAPINKCPKCKSVELYAGQILCGGCAKLDSGKPVYSLEDLRLLAEIKRFQMEGPIRGFIEVLRVGEKKYAIHSWRNVPPEKYIAALIRHLLAIANGEYVDAESGLPHWDHVACNVEFLRELGHFQGNPAPNQRREDEGK